MTYPDTSAKRKCSGRILLRGGKAALSSASLLSLIVVITISACETTKLTNPEPQATMFQCVHSCDGHIQDFSYNQNTGELKCQCQYDIYKGDSCTPSKDKSTTSKNSSH
jgi:hypothetical protein